MKKNQARFFNKAKLWLKKLYFSAPKERTSLFKKAYSSLYDVYGNAKKTNSNDIQKQEFLYKLLVGRGKDILEIGCGDGKLLSRLSNISRNCVGIDLFPSKYWQASKNLKFISTDAVLPKIKKHFDVIISIQFIEHIHPDDIESHLMIIYKLLKKSGVFILETPNAITRGTYKRIGYKTETMIWHLHLKEWSYQELKNILSGTGFLKINTFFLPMSFAKYHFARFGIIPIEFLLFLEKMIRLIPVSNLRRLIGRLIKMENCIIIANK